MLGLAGPKSGLQPLLFVRNRSTSGPLKADEQALST